MTGISIIIPLGPNPIYKSLLKECLRSIGSQMKYREPIEEKVALDEVIFVDDAAHLELRDVCDDLPGHTYKKIDNGWLLGCAASWNIGISSARNEWCIMMGSDDTLLPGALDACREIINNKPDPLGWYNFTCLDSDGEQYSWYNNAAMVSRKLWAATGGFPITASLGAPDALLVSIMIAHFPDHLHKIKEGTSLYKVRIHPDQNGKQYAGVFNQQVIDVRNVETARWTKPEWTQNL